jgi:hypothetical protein
MGVRSLSLWVSSADASACAAAMAMAIAIATMSVSCVNSAGSKDTLADRGGRSAATTSEAVDAAGAARKAASAPAATPEGRDVCTLLAASEVMEITGVTIERTAKTPDGCEWYASAEAQQQKGAATARSSFEQLTKQEPKSAADAVRTMENLLKGAGGATAPTKPLFAATVHWNDGDQAETMFKGTVAVNGGGQPGGALDPIDGLGDRAFIGAMGMLFYVRKGPALVLFGAMGITREQEIALARKFVAKL